jgi:hypothetical protein
VASDAILTLGLRYLFPLIPLTLRLEEEQKKGERCG